MAVTPNLSFANQEAPAPPGLTWGRSAPCLGSRDVQCTLLDVQQDLLLREQTIRAYLFLVRDETSPLTRLSGSDYLVRSSA